MSVILKVFLMVVPILDLLKKILRLSGSNRKTKKKKSTKVISFIGILIYLVFNFFLVKCGLTYGVFWNILLCCLYLFALSMYDTLAQFEKTFNTEKTTNDILSDFITLVFGICIQYGAGYYAIFFR